MRYTPLKRGVNEIGRWILELALLSGGLFFRFLVLLAFTEALLFESEAAGAEVAAAEGDDVGANARSLNFSSLQYELSLPPSSSNAFFRPRSE